MITTNIFLVHFICYWTMVYLYDKNVQKKILYKSCLLSLKNQFMYTYPVIHILFKYYPMIYFYLFVIYLYW